jgi:DNA-binding transcriptional MocR family regulator
MPEEVRWNTPGGGPTLWLDYPAGFDLRALARALLAHGVFIEDTSPAFFGEPHLNGFRVSYAFLPEAALRRALERVAVETKRLLSGA